DDDHRSDHHLHRRDHHAAAKAAAGSNQAYNRSAAEAVPMGGFFVGCVCGVQEETMKALWDKFRAWCDYSETIVWARLQLVVGAVWTVLVATDLSPILSSKWLTVWLIVSGTITEVLRRIKHDTTL